MALEIAFIGYNRVQTSRHFIELHRANWEQTALINLSGGVIILRDGTIIRRIDKLEDITGRRFDQIIIADDRRRNIYASRLEELAALELSAMCSPVPEEFRRIHYDADWRE